MLTNEPLLIYLYFTIPFVLTTDARNEALGAILSQGPIGQDLPIPCASRTPTNSEKNYSTTEKERLAIVTDHKPLTWVWNVKDPSSRLLRWRLKLEEYDYDVVHKVGVRNADALSRITMTRISPVAENCSQPTKETRRKILQEFHEQPTGGHLGMNRAFERIKLYISWPVMKQEIEYYIKHFDICKNKITQKKTKLPLQITDTPGVV